MFMGIFLALTTAVAPLEIRLDPNPWLVGHHARLECIVSEPERVVRVMLVLLDGALQFPLVYQGNGVYRIERDLPPETPTGEFPATIVVEWKDGSRTEHPFTATIQAEQEQTFASLEPTFTLDEVEGFLVPRQNGAVYPSLERQSSRVGLELSGLWFSRRFPEADHDRSLTRRTPEVVTALEAEMPEVFSNSGFSPQSAGWDLSRVPGPNNLPPDRYQGCTWYLRDFHLPATWRGARLRLIFLAANYVTDVWLNGRWLGYHEGGYTPFVFDVTDMVRLGRSNRLIVRVDNIPWRPRKRSQESDAWHNHQDIVPYVTADWWNYGGILRDVYLERMPSTHIIRLDAQGLLREGHPVLTGTVLVADPPPEGTVRLALRPVKADALLEMFLDRIVDEGLLGETEVALQTLGEGLGAARFEFPVPQAQPWTPEEPHLYALQATIPGGETFTIQVGFRTIRTEGARLLWNGEPRFLKGAARHEDYPALGRGISYADGALVLRDLESLKRMHANFIRLGHYPNHPMTTLLTDRVGLIAWEEIPVYWFSSTGFQIQQKRGIARQMQLEMIYTDYNRPSIGFWSACNECSSERERRAYLHAWVRLAKRVDGSRLIAQSAAGASVDRTQEELDVIGMTLYHGVFYGKDPYQDTLALLDKVHEAIPNKPIVCTEFGYWAGSQWGSAEKQTRIAEETLRALSERDFVWGCTWWIGFDYATFHTGINTMGAITLDRAVERPVYHRLAKWYAQKLP